MFFIKNKSLTVHGKKEAGMSVAIILSWNWKELRKLNMALLILYGLLKTVRLAASIKGKGKVLNSEWLLRLCRKVNVITVQPLWFTSWHKCFWRSNTWTLYSYSFEEYKHYTLELNLKFSYMKSEYFLQFMFHFLVQQQLRKYTTSITTIDVFSGISQTVFWLIVD